MPFSDRLSALRFLPASGGLLACMRPHWLQQIPRCLPARLRRWIAARRPKRLIEVDGSQARVLREIGGQREQLGVLALDVAASPVTALRTQGQRPAWVETRLELPSAAVLRRRLTLPNQVRSQLRTVVGYEIDRLTPFTRDAVYFDARILDEWPGAAKLSVELALCRRDQAHAWLTYLRAAGAPVDRLTWQGAWPGANLLPSAERPRKGHLGLLIDATLGVLLLLMVATLLISPLWQRHQTQLALERQLRDLRTQALAVTEVREELEQARLGSVAVLQRKAEAPRMSDLLRELTDLLPDGTWVQTLNYRDDEVDIRGESTQATALIALLENGPGISKVTFRSPVMQIASSGTERFHISFSYQRPSP